MHEVVVPSLLSVIMLGAVIMAFLYHLVVFFFRRDPLLLHYLAFLFATGLFTLITSGLLHVWLETDAEQYILRFLAEPIEIIYFALYFNFILQSIEVTRSPDSFLFRSWILIVSVLFLYAIGFFVFRTMGIFKSYTPGFVAIRIFIFFLTAIMLYQCFRLRHVTFQLFILLGSGCYFLFGLTAFIANFNATPTMWIRPPEWLILGSFIDIIFFSIALSYRYRMIWQHMNREKLEAANELIRVKDELLEKQSALQNERRRIAADMHDDLGSGLTQITYLSQGLKRNEQQEAIIGKISDTASGLVQNLSEIIWAMKEENNSLRDLISYIRSYTSDYLETNNMEYRMNVPEINQDISISGEIRRNLFLSIKEALHNIVRHSGAKNAVIDISADDSLIVFIADDGVGIPEEIRRGANGIANMKRRIADIGGTMTLVSNAGTSIYFRLPMPKNPSFGQ